MPNKPLSLALVEQGRFQAKVDAALRRGARYLARYIEHYGQAAVGGVYAVGFKVKLVAGDHGRVRIVTSRITQTEPAEPGEETYATAHMFGDGDFDLFVPASGSDRDPEQVKLFTDDGRLPQQEI